MAVNIAKLLAKNLGKGATAKTLKFRSMTLVRVSPGTRGAVLSAGNNATSTNYACTGTRAEKSVLLQDGGGERTSFVQINILGGTLAAGIIPRPTDRIIDSADGKTYIVNKNGTKDDQVQAMYVCYCTAPGA
jgi:hypothetical protein